MDHFRGEHFFCRGFKFCVDYCNKEINNNQDANESGLNIIKAKLKIRIMIAIFHLLQLFFAYCMMLIIMTFNFLLFIISIYGVLFGYFVIQIIESRMDMYKINGAKIHKL